jgi:hypothetical protein
MESKKLSTILVLKLICCGAILFFVLGGAGLLSLGILYMPVTSSPEEGSKDGEASIVRC